MLIKTWKPNNADKQHDFRSCSGDSQLFAGLGQQPILDFSDKPFNKQDGNESQDNIRTLVLQRDFVDIRLHRPVESVIRERDKPMKSSTTNVTGEQRGGIADIALRKCSSEKTQLKDLVPYLEGGPPLRQGQDNCKIDRHEE